MGDESANAYAPSMTSQNESQASRQTRETLGSSSTTSGYVKRRKKKPNFSQLQTIQIERAPEGFGFLIAGNSPCYLSQVFPGTPAEKAGLMAGQYIMTINGENASTWRVDKVVEYIVNSGNRLLLNVAMDDDVSAEEDQVRSKPPKPTPLQRGAHNMRYGPGNTPRSVPSSWTNIANFEIPINERLSSKVFGSYASSDALGSCNSDPSNRGSSLSSSNDQYPTPVTSASSGLKEESGSVSSLDCQRASSCSSASTAKTKSSQAESTNLHHPQRMSIMSVSGKLSSDNEWLNSQASSKSSLRHLNNSSDIFSAAASGNFYSVVGYVRSIDIPSQTKDQISIMTALLNSVKKHDRKINFVLLLEVSDTGIRLINSKKSTVTSISFTSIISCISLGDEKQFFGILARRPNEGEGPSGPVSCMVLAIDPQIAHHEVHVKAAKKFTLACTRVTSTLCKEFPVECGAIIAKIQSKLPNVGTGAFDVICSRSSVSNSDSGIAMCKDKLCKVCVHHLNAAKVPHHAVSIRDTNVPSLSSNINNWFENRNPRPLSEMNPARYNDVIEATSSQHADGRYAQRHSEHRPSSVYQPTTVSHINQDPYSQNFNGPPSLPVNPPSTSIKSPPPDPSERVRPTSRLNQINSWAANFDNLLNDPKGVAIFTEFLKKEFAEENIIFYQLCQDFKALFDYHEMKELALKIYQQHLASNCPHPVNLDSQVLQSVYEKLESNLISRDIFDEAVLQIYKLMKFDPYSRFLKSEVYSDCVKNSVCSPSKADPGMKDEKRANFSVGSSEATSDDSNCQAEGKKGAFIKKSLLPWKKKTKPRNDSTDSSVKSLEKTRGLSQSSDSLLLSIPSQSSIEASSQCKVYLPNGCHVIVECDHSKTVSSTVMTLCMEYNLNLRCLDVVDSEHRAIPLGETLRKFAGGEIYLERRVYFRLQLPTTQTIGVKSKPNISIKDVFQPLLVKYRLSLNNLIIRLADSTTPLNLQLAVAVLDSKRVIADTIEQYNEHTLGKENAHTQSVPLTQVKQEPQISASLATRRPRRPEPTRHEYKPAALSRPSNEEHQFVSSRHETDGVNHRYETSDTTSNQTDLNSEQGQFIGLIAKVQGDRLDNQRGIMSVSKLEMPTFLEPNVPRVHNHSTPEKWHDCCFSSSCTHLNYDDAHQWQSTLIYPPHNSKNRHQDGRPPTGRHRKVVYPNGNPGRHPTTYGTASQFPSLSSSKHLSREITPIPGNSDQYYNISPDASSFDIYPSELPSPSTTGVYPLTAPPSPSNLAPMSSDGEFPSYHSYEQTPAGPVRKPSPSPMMMKSNSAEWYHSPISGGSLDGIQRSNFGSHNQTRTHGSTLSSASKPDTNLHYPSAASSQSVTSMNADIRTCFNEEPDEVPEEIGHVQIYQV